MWINLNSLRPSLALSLWKKETESVSCSVVFDPSRPHGLHVERQAPLSMGFPRQECWSGWPFLSPGDLPNPGIKPRSPALQAGRFLTVWANKQAPAFLFEKIHPWKTLRYLVSSVPFLQDGGFSQSQVLFVWFCFAETCTFSAQIFSQVHLCSEGLLSADVFIRQIVVGCLHIWLFWTALPILFHLASGYKFIQLNLKAPSKHSPHKHDFPKHSCAVWN